MTTLRLRKSSDQSLRRHGFLLPSLTLVLAWLALAPAARAQLSPPPGGSYPGENTAEGTDALFSLTIGVLNTANGFQALFSNTTGNANTANGVNALLSNTTLRPDYAEAWNNIGAAYNKLGRYAEAAAACEESLRFKPDFQLARNNLQYAYEMAKSSTK